MILNSCFQEFIAILNPCIKYGALNSLFYEQLKRYWIFDNSSTDELMFIAHEMRPVLCIDDETIIYQNEAGSQAYIIAEGKVKIIIKTTTTSDIKDDINNEVELKSFI